MRRCLFGLFLWFVLIGCRAESILPPTPTPDVRLPQETPALVPATTPIVVDPPTVTGAWQFREPRTTSNVALVESESGFALDPQWQIAKVEYSYNWWGLSTEPALENQVVQRDNGSFTRDNVPISAEAMAAFVASVVRFQPTQAYVYGNSWTDDYPSHTIELTGIDGQQLLFISTSTGNPGDGPWNLVYNDRLYAQYDGAFGYGLEEIFDYEMRGSVADMVGTNSDYEPEVHFSTSGLPLQLEYGFDGLLPVAESFRYHADLESQTITGSLVGRSSIGGFGNMVIGTFPSLESITLATPDEVTCDAEAIEIDDPVGAAWTFTCTIPNAIAEMPFLYPITIVLQNDKGVPTPITGNLSGLWSESPRPLRLPLPPFLQSALEENSDAAAILARHQYAVAGYSASLEPEPPNAIRTIGGDITFFGTTNHAGQPVRYRVTTSFNIQADGAVEWYLTPAELDALIADTIALPESQTLLKAYPATSLHLGYFPPIEQIRRFMDSYQSAMPGAYPAWCGIEPSEGEMEATLIRSVGYLLNDSDSALYGGLNEERQFRASYASLRLDEGLPSVIFPDGTVLDEGYLRLNRSGGWNSLTFGFAAAEATEERIARFEALAEGIGATLNYSESSPAEHPEWWVGNAYSIQVAENGNLQLVACE